MSFVRKRKKEEEKRKIKQKKKKRKIKRMKNEERKIFEDRGNVVGYKFSRGVEREQCQENFGLTQLLLAILLNRNHFVKVIPRKGTIYGRSENMKYRSRSFHNVRNTHTHITPISIVIRTIDVLIGLKITFNRIIKSSNTLKLRRVLKRTYKNDKLKFDKYCKVIYGKFKNYFLLLFVRCYINRHNILPT